MPCAGRNDYALSWQVLEGHLDLRPAPFSSRHLFISQIYLTKISPPLTLALDETLVCGIRAWRGSCRLVKDLHDARRQEPSHAKVLLK